MDSPTPTRWWARPAIRLQMPNFQLKGKKLLRNISNIITPL